MEGIFIKLLNLSIQASILIVVVLLLRVILNKSPRWMKCFLWTLVAIREEHISAPYSLHNMVSWYCYPDSIRFGKLLANMEKSKTVYTYKSILLCRDIELACDEKVIKDMDAKQKKIYSKVLLSFSESEKHILACPLAFGEVGVKDRIKSILNYKKPTIWIIAVAVISILVTSVLFLTSPQNNTYEITFHIPAGCENQLVFSDEEISPKGKIVSFLVGQDVGDTAIQLKGVEVKEENAYDEPLYATPGMPAKMEVEKGAWFQVGIYASNDTAEEKTVHVTVKDVEVRIAAMDIQSSYHTIFEETNSTGTDTLQDSRNSDGTPSRAYVETLQERISADMAAAKLPFVVTSAIRENPLRLEVELTEMTDENITIIRSYETNGSAITLVQSSGNVQDLQHNNDSQSQMAPKISKEDENMGVEYEETNGGYVVEGDMVLNHIL